MEQFSTSDEYQSVGEEGDIILDNEDSNSREANK